MATHLTHDALHTTPALQQHHLGDLAVDTIRVIALRTLGTGKKVALCPPAKAATYHAHVLHEDKLVCVGEENHSILHGVVIVVFLLFAGRAIDISNQSLNGRSS